MLNKIEYLVQTLYRQGKISVSEGTALLSAVEYCSTEPPQTMVEKYGNQIVEGFNSLQNERRFFNVQVPKD